MTELPNQTHLHYPAKHNHLDLCPGYVNGCFYSTEHLLEQYPLVLSFVCSYHWTVGKGGREALRNFNSSFTSLTKKRPQQLCKFISFLDIFSMPNHFIWSFLTLYNCWCLVPDPSTELPSSGASSAIRQNERLPQADNVLTMYRQCQWEVGRDTACSMCLKIASSTQI